MMKIDSHILLAEDNPVNQEVIQEMLSLLGCRTQVVSDHLSLDRTSWSIRISNV